jgi:Flp pilus assembly protein TadB/Mg-chelatase subunit ChlD
MRRFSGALAAVAAALVLVTGGPAHAEETGGLEVTGVQATAGQVKFFLAARGVPASELTGQTVTVAAGAETLPVKVEQFAGDGSAKAAEKPRAVVLVIDTSGSMNEGDRIGSAKAAASAYAAGLPADVELGLVTFADAAATALAPTTDRAAFSDALDKVTAHGATALYDGVKHALGLFGPADRYSERRLVVLSDGADTVSKTTVADLRTQLSGAKAALDVVAVTAEAASTEVAQLATGTGGQLISATDADAARKAFRKLASALSAPVLVTVTVPPALSGKMEQLAVKLSTVDGDAKAAVAVQFGVDPRAAPDRQYQQIPVTSKVLLWGGVAAVGGALLLAVGVGLYLAMGRSALRRRLRQLDAFTADKMQSNMVKQEQQGSPLLRKALELSEKAVERNNQRGRIASALERAGMDLRPQEWYLIRAGVSVVTAVLLALLMPWWFGIVGGLVAGWFGTAMYRSFKEGRRTRKFADLLPDALQLVVSAIRSGFSLAQAIDAVVREGPDPINTEFGRALAETRLGGDMEDALERAAARNGSRDLAWLVMAIRIQREVGGNLSEVLETATDTMRERARLARHVRGLSAEGRLSAYILTGMPIMVSGWMFYSNGEYLRPLYTEPLGLMMLGGGIGSLCLGVFWMSRIVKVEV